MGTPLLFDEEFEVVIMIAASDRRDAWVGPSPDLRGLQGEPWLVGTGVFQLERSGALFKADAELRS